ncbi:hypothetical protein CERSUDRAFT_78560 [Gelatoporia subvermispora B]|uniref:Uncharacterized protein n=1 Tax=Ceriporiopsis subvermispora (strain B) TaxID=914234 RepID=M2P6F9_CERS8|nr:hypothetical protein CERSUDRAFT_78560 [Gelatoporia subvermispora B]
MCTTGYRRRDGQTFQLWFDSHIQGLLSAPSASSFSSTFSSMFGSDATGTVNGRAADRSGVQRALRALREKWDKASGKVEKAQTTPGTDQNAAVKLIWKLDGKQVQAYCAACCCEDTDGTNIDDITLEGDASLFS